MIIYSRELGLEQGQSTVLALKKLHFLPISVGWESPTWWVRLRWSLVGLCCPWRTVRAAQIMVRTLAFGTLVKFECICFNFHPFTKNETSKVLEFSKKGQYMWNFQFCLHFVMVVNGIRRFGILPYYNEN